MALRKVLNLRNGFSSEKKRGSSTTNLSIHGKFDCNRIPVSKIDDCMNAVCNCNFHNLLNDVNLGRHILYLEIPATLFLIANAMQQPFHCLNFEWNRRVDISQYSKLLLSELYLYGILYFTVWIQFIIDTVEMKTHRLHSSNFVLNNLLHFIALYGSKSHIGRHQIQYCSDYWNV